MTCRTQQLGEVCYTNPDGASTPLFVTHVYDSDSVLISTVFHNSAGQEVNVTTGIVRPGPCMSQISYGRKTCVETSPGVFREALAYAEWNGVVLTPKGFVAADTLTPLPATTVVTNPCNCVCVDCP